MDTNMIFGRYYAADSPVHRMDARVKLTLLLVFIAAAIFTQTPEGLVILIAFTVAFYIFARIPVRTALSSVAPLLLIVLLTAFANLFFVQQGAVYFHWAFITITERGCYLAVFMGIRLTILLFAACLLTLTTTTLDITDAFETMLKPFTRIGVPAHELSMIMGIALRFLPQFAEELAYTRNAQTSRGARLSEGSLKERVAALKTLIIPLFTSVFRHAETLAGAMDARCYHGGPGRTRLNTPKVQARDFVAMAIMAVLVAAVVATNILL